MIVSPAFAGKRLIERHRLVMDIARAKLDSNELHAVDYQALTPEEWAQKPERCATPSPRLFPARLFRAGPVKAELKSWKN